MAVTNFTYVINSTSDAEANELVHIVQTQTYKPAT